MQIRRKIERVVSYLARRQSLTFISDKVFLQIYYYLKTGKKLNLKNPRTYNEKLQWIKLYDRNKLYTQLVDKYEVRKYVEKVIGEEILIPLIGVWDSFDKINFDELPDKFVLKCTHDSGGIVICDDKVNLNISLVKNKINKCLKRNFYNIWREWPYKYVPHRIIAEEYMQDKKDNDLKDYKFYCFDGEVKLIVINSDRSSNNSTKGDYFDKNFDVINLTWGFEHHDVLPEKPKQFDKMIEIAEKLSNNLKHVRVDLYFCNNNIYFGEMTFFDGSGFTEIKPEEWNLKLGEYINLLK